MQDDNKTCATCKHWSGKSAALPAGKGMCVKSTYGNPAERKFFSAASGLITMSDFGCNQHEQKPAQSEPEEKKPEHIISDNAAARTNMLISLFMGCGFNDPIITYNRDWALLMPVINKCFALVLMYGINKQHEHDERYNFVRAAICSALKRSDIDWQVRITPNYLKVVEFVEWYNTIKQK